jgi:hypothetical protein
VLQKEILEIRKSKELLATVETACVARLHKKHELRLGSSAAAVAPEGQEAQENQLVFDEVDEE